MLGRVQLFVTLWTAAHQAPLFMGFSRQGYWSGLPFTISGKLPDLGIEPVSPVLLHRPIFHQQHHLGSPIPGIVLV